jgi:thiamine kinase-like enzyme
MIALPERDAQIKNYLAGKKWLTTVDSISFLAAGEYNENYLVRGDKGRFVLRINHGSQLGLKNQIGYEYRVLKAVEPSRVTPIAYHCDSDPGELGGGVLLMQYLEGRPLDYEKDIESPAHIFSRIHALPVQEDLVVQQNPVQAIAEESVGLIKRFSKHPLKKVKKALLTYHEQIRKLGERSGEVFQNEPLCLVNTEVNSGNFIISRTKGYLVDWEKTVISYRYQDLGHFLVPTTTLWKSEFRFTPEGKSRFLSAYREFLHLDLDLSEISEKTKILERTILLRALSWCFMAYYEYTQTKRALKNQVTFNKIRSYLKEIDSFLKPEEGVL